MTTPRGKLKDADSFAKEVLRLWAAGEQCFYDAELQANLAAAYLRLRRDA